MEYFTRNCPTCKDSIRHANKYEKARSERAGKLCRKCQNAGSKNGFHGKRHSDSTKAIIASRDTSYMHTKSFSDAVVRGMGGKTNTIPVYDCWVASHGKEWADHRLTEYRRKQSINSSGSNNPMYGKPAPNGSGNGWKGWLDSRFFRSLRELAFMLSNPEAVSAESVLFEVKYSYLGSDRTYRPDFVVDGVVYECKPKRLHSSKLVTAKREAAIAKFSEIGLRYEVVDPDIPGVSLIRQLEATGRLKWMGKYKEKFDNYAKDNLPTRPPRQR